MRNFIIPQLFFGPFAVFLDLYNAKLPHSSLDSRINHTIRKSCRWPVQFTTLGFDHTSIAMEPASNGAACLRHIALLLKFTDIAYDADFVLLGYLLRQASCSFRRCNSAGERKWVGKRMRDKPNAAEWSDRIRKLLGDLNLSQAALAERLGLSPPTISRWLQGRHEPTAEGYIALGNLANSPDRVYFWERAGINTTSLIGANAEATHFSVQIDLNQCKLIAGRKTAAILSSKTDKAAVAIPLMNATAYGDRIPPHENVVISEAEVEDILFAPLSWCPNPESMVGMHFEGDSMLPVIPPGSILFVDRASTDRDRLNQRIAVVSHRDLGFKVARFQRIAGSDLLVSANYQCPPLDVSNSTKWKFFGEVLWWVSRDMGQ
jgi:transcriptional regulator with XRE-family HTH domain